MNTGNPKRGRLPATARRNPARADPAAQRLDEIFAVMDQGVIAFDAQDRITFVNQTLRDILQVPDDLLATGQQRRDLVEFRARRGDYGDRASAEHVIGIFAEGRDTEIELAGGGSDRVYRVASRQLPGGGFVATYTDVTALKERERQIEENSLALAVTLDNMKHGISWVDEELVLRQFNQEFLRLLDIPADRIGKGKSTLEDYFRFNAERGEYGPGDPEQQVAELVARARRKEPHVIERTRADGTIIRIEGVPVPEGGCVTVYTDVTEERRREAEIRDNSRALELILGNISQGLALLDHDGRVLAANRRLAVLFDVPPEALATGCAFGLLDPDRAAERGGRLAVLSRAGEDGAGQPLREELELRRRDGAVMRIERQRNSDGGWVITCTEMTEIQRREEQLQSLARELEAANAQKQSLLADLETVIENIDYGVVFMDENLCPTIINRAYRNLWGLEETASPGSMRDLMEHIRHNGVYDVEDAGWEDYVAARTAAVRAGDIAPVEMRLRNGKVLRYACATVPGGRRMLTYYDLTDIKRREEELERSRRASEAANRAKSEFLANMSHEIRTPMNGVLGMTEILAQTALDERQAQCVEIIEKSGSALITIINDILDFSKIEAGKLGLDPTPIDVEVVIGDVMALMASTVSQKGLELSLDIAPGTPTRIVADAGRLRQVVTNLVGNAVKFTDRGKVSVAVAGTRRGGAADLEITVADTGVGIAADKLGRIFDQFEQADNSTTRRYGGTGLGLAITRRLVDLMGGTVAVESTPGQGTSFRVTLSLPIDPGQAAGAGSAKAAEALRILVVGDIAANRRALCEQLGKWSYGSLDVADADEACNALRTPGEGAFGAAIVDFRVPHAEGYDLVRRLRDLPEGRDLPVVMLLPAADDSRMPMFADLGISAWLAKPMRVSVLRETVAAAIGSARTAVDRGASPATVEAERPPENEAAYRVLLAEDNAVNRRVVEMMLAGSRYRLITAADGRAAVEAFRSGGADLVLMDVSMPDMDGYEATRIIRLIEVQKGLDRVPIIAMTAHALESDRQRCVVAGMDDYLPKPVGLSSLREMLAKWLGKEDAAGVKSGSDRGPSRSA